MYVDWTNFFKEITKSFKNNIVLDDVNLTFKEGNIYGLIGRNGSGKSVFLKILCGFYRPDKGKIIYDGLDLFESSSFPPDTRCMIEKPTFIPDLSGFDNLKLLAKIQNKISDNQILDTMKKLNLDKEINKSFSKYSLGTKQKLGIAQVLMENPKIIILDEPFNGIENSTVELVRNLLLEEKKKGKIIIIATHIKEDLEKLVDEVYEFDNGKVKKIRRN